MQNSLTPEILPELESVTRWLRALPSYQAQDNVYFRSRLSRMQFEELLGRPAPSFVQQPPRMTVIQQLYLIAACQEYGWQRQNRESITDLQTKVSISRHELDVHPQALQYMEHEIAAQFGVKLLEMGYLQRFLLADSDRDYHSISLGYRLDLELRPNQFRYSEPMGNAYYDGEGRTHNVKRRTADGRYEPVNENTRLR